MPFILPISKILLLVADGVIATERPVLTKCVVVVLVHIVLMLSTTCITAQALGTSVPPLASIVWPDGTIILLALLPELRPFKFSTCKVLI